MHRPHALKPLLRRHLAIGTFAGATPLVEGLRALQAAGFEAKSLSVLARDEAEADLTLASTPGARAVNVASPVSLSQDVEHTGSEEVSGAVLGGGVGLLLGLTALAVPGVGSAILAAGPLAVLIEALVATTGGAGMGALIGAILDDRGSTELCETFEAALQRGAWLLVVHGDAPATRRASQVLAAAGAQRVDTL